MAVAWTPNSLHANGTSSGPAGTATTNIPVSASDTRGAAGAATSPTPASGGDVGASATSTSPAMPRAWPMLPPSSAFSLLSSSSLTSLAVCTLTQATVEIMAGTARKSRGVRGEEANSPLLLLPHGESQAARSASLFEATQGAIHAIGARRKGQAKKCCITDRSKQRTAVTPCALVPAFNAILPARYARLLWRLQSLRGRLR